MNWSSDQYGICAYDEEPSESSRRRYQPDGGGVVSAQTIVAQQCDIEAPFASSSTLYSLFELDIVTLNVDFSTQNAKWFKQIQCWASRGYDM